MWAELWCGLRSLADPRANYGPEPRGQMSGDETVSFRARGREPRELHHAPNIEGEEGLLESILFM